MWVNIGAYVCLYIYYMISRASGVIHRQQRRNLKEIMEIAFSVLYLFERAYLKSALHTELDKITQRTYEENLIAYVLYIVYGVYVKYEQLH